ncbi:hypothetical protein [Mucilaginibacter flavidus]|uniref:hypothetical protein n=1 Tax=Mucilaginibacter flavidus TaxID=2949309 RepID=UPI002091FFAD|nr:hypothetical protein [Mucilaginibacter flavidus]MCO5946701.1 hypothetical protein [Mucilaginibacter flavidus]
MNKVQLNKFVVKAVLFGLPVFILFEILFRLGFAPIVTSSDLFDAKMRHIKKQQVKQVNLMAIGSSITLYELKSDLVTQNLDTSYYNFASWGTQITDMKLMLAKFIPEHQPKYVIICASLGEFMSLPNSTYSNYLNTPTFIRNNLPELFYLKNYNSIHQIIWRKYFEYPICFDVQGGALLTVKPKDINRKIWDAHDEFPTRHTQSNYNGLDSLAVWLKQQNIKFIFIQAPIKKSFANTVYYQQQINMHFEKCRSIIESRGGIYLNYYNTTIFTDSLFVDQYHLQNAGAIIFTKKIVADLKKVIK